MGIDSTRAIDHAGAALLRALSADFVGSYPTPKPRDRGGRPMTLHLTDPPPPAAEEPTSQPNLLIPVACGVILLLLAAVLWAQSGRRDALGQVVTLEAQ